MSEKFLPIAAMEKLFKKAGVDRSSDKAKVALKEVLEDYAVKITKLAFEFAVHAGRKTIKKSDIKLAVESLKKK